jgi:peptide/nickel transport system substrate-binding protein
MLPPPEGVWGMPPDLVETLPGYGRDVGKRRAEAREIVEKLGYGPGHRLQTKVSTRNLPPYRDPAVILIDQLKEIYVDAELDLIDTVNWFPKMARKDYTVGLNLTLNGLDDPDQTLYEYYACGARWASTSPSMASTTPTKPCTSITRAAPRETLTVTATPRLTR